MTLSVKEQTAISRFLAKLKKQPQTAVADSIGVSRQDLSTWKAVSRAIGLDCPQATPGRRKVSIAKPRATTKAVIAARATRSSRSNGAAYR
jgi:hypothetical protein